MALSPVPIRLSVDLIFIIKNQSMPISSLRERHQRMQRMKKDYPSHLSIVLKNFWFIV